MVVPELFASLLPVGVALMHFHYRKSANTAASLCFKLQHVRKLVYFFCWRKWFENWTRYLRAPYEIFLGKTNVKGAMLLIWMIARIIISCNFTASEGIPIYAVVSSEVQNLRSNSGALSRVSFLQSELSFSITIHKPNVLLLFMEQYTFTNQQRLHPTYI